MYVYRPGKKLLLASSDGRGFVVPTDEVLAQTRAGRQVLNLDGKVTGQFCVAAEGNLVAVSGTNRKLVIFPLSEIPEMNRGRGVALAKKDVQIADIKVFAKTDGLSWKSGERTRKVDDIRPWVGKRAQAGRMVPEGFPRNNRFST